MLLTSKYLCASASSSVFLDAAIQAAQPLGSPEPNINGGWSDSPIGLPPALLPGAEIEPRPQMRPDEIDPLYLFSCHLAWEQEEEPSAAWELLAASQSSNPDTRAHARALLGSSKHFSGLSQGSASCRAAKQKRFFSMETDMAPYGLEIIDDCTDCVHPTPGFFCGLPPSALRALNEISHKSILPEGAILFVEGQSPRGMFILCSGKVNLSTASREGKILILKTADAGEVLGLSASVSGAGYESTAETATPCLLNFVDRKDYLELMQSHSEIGLHTAQALSRDYQAAYRDIHDLVLTRSSAGKLARLLLSYSPMQGMEAETRIHSTMTHEEMAQRIGSSRETVTRLLSVLKKKQLIRLDGPTLVIRDRSALEALAV
ncbi:MAG TPA: Crp/Fnr family transcriptional regulator [Candidatus Sulfotelmatobacter sp.]|nr:Crp/Fnr family transcriptional regulator [Candidatus Sulfotelmatobacter sp.]